MRNVVELRMSFLLDHCRASERFEVRDFEYLRNLLAGGEAGGFLMELVDDRDELLIVLDSRQVFEDLIESNSLLEVSVWFYFYVLVRHSLLRSGLDDYDLADYLGFVLASSLKRKRSGFPWGVSYGVDFLSLLDGLRGEERFRALVEGGNQFLMMVGIFPEFVERRSVRRGAPGVRFYEGVARDSYREARRFPQAESYGLRPVLGVLASEMRETRRSLRRMSDSLLFLAS